MSEKRFEVSFDEKRIFDIYGVNKNTPEYDIHKSCDLINSLYEENEQLMEENKKLKGLIKGNVFGKYREGSLADLEFKATAYDDIIKLEMSYESEPKVIVTCKQGKKENVKSFCQMFIPLGVYYEIKEVRVGE